MATDFLPTGPTQTSSPWCEGPCTTELFVLNKDATNLNEEKPEAHEAGTATDTANIIMAGNPGLQYLDLYVAVAGTSDITTDPVVKVYGLLPNRNIVAGRQHPVDEDSTNFYDPGGAGIWVPLKDSAGNIDITIVGHVEATYDEGSGSQPDWALSVPTKVPLTGVLKVMVLVTTAAANGSASDSFIVGRMYNET